MHVAKDKVMKFKEVQSGLYTWIPGSTDNIYNKKNSSYSFLSLVSDNKNKFTRREIKQAEKARELYRYIDR